MSNRTSLDYKEKRIVEKALLAVCKNIAPDIASYDEGWCDDRVAIEVAEKHKFEVTKNNVAGLRRKLVGGLLKAPDPEPAPAASMDMECRLLKLISEGEQHIISEMEHALARMSARMAEIERNTRYVHKRDETTQTHLIGLYARVGAIEKKLGIEASPATKADTPALTALGEQLRDRYGIESVAK